MGSRLAAPQCGRFWRLWGGSSGGWAATHVDWDPRPAGETMKEQMGWCLLLH